MTRALDVLLDLRGIAGAVDRRLAGGALANCAAAVQETQALRLERRYEESELSLLGPAVGRPALTG